MCPFAVSCWLIGLLALHSVSHGQSAADKRHNSLIFDPGKVFLTKVFGTPKTSLYDKPEDATGNIPELLKDSLKHLKFHSAGFPIRSGHQHPSDHKRHHIQKLEGHGQGSRDIISSAAYNERIGIKGSERQGRDEFMSGYGKSGELAEGPYLRGRTIHSSSKRKRERISGRSGCHADEKTDGNWYPCGPQNLCICKMTFADCTGLGLVEFPRSLPRGVQIIRASYNNISRLSLHSLTFYEDLREADISFNLITELEQFSVNVKHPMCNLNLEGNKLHTLERSRFGVLGNLTWLNLSKNKITFISDQLFSSLKNLRTLDLSCNTVQRIEVNAFDSLIKLRNLKLDNNVQLGYSNAKFPPRLFMYLKALGRLWIQGNADKKNDRSYPNEALAHLKGLIELTIDGLGGGAELGHQIEGLKLRGLVFGFRGNCFIKNLSSTFFQHVPFLLRLTFYGCPLHRIDRNTFAKLDKLVNYTIAYPASHYDFQDALEDLQGLQNKSLIALALVGFLEGKTKCRTLTGEDVYHIGRFPLHYLYLDFNYISYIEDEFIGGIPPTLREFSLRGNKFTFIDYRWNLLMNFTNLYTIDIRDQNMSPYISYQNNWCEDQISHHSNTNGQNGRKITKDLPVYSPTDINFIETRQSECNNKRYEYCEYEPVYVTESPDTISYLENTTCNPYDRHQACVPPNLKVVRASGFTEFGRALLYHNRSKNDLCYLDFSRGFFTDWGNGILPIHVKIADFSDNFCDRLDADFFPHNNQLRYLCISNNYLGPSFSEDVNGTIFSRAQSLKYLSIAMNNIFKLPASFFKGLKSLEILDMHDNKLQVLDLDISLTPSLRDIDLSENSINWISRRARRGLDALAVNHSIMVNLLYNPLPCSCDGAEVLQWLANTRVILKYKRFLTCSSHTEEKVLLGDIKKRLRSLNRKCIPNSDLLIIISCCCSIFILVIICGLRYKYRWRLIYARNIWLVNMYGFRPVGRGSSQRMYDAYVVYSEEDKDFALNTMIEELEVRRGHKLCVEERNFVPGIFNFNNITCAIQNSTVTLLLLSPDFLATRELEYATQMALMEQRNRQERRDVILLFRYTEIPIQKLTKDLFTLMRQGRYLDYPRDQDEIVKQQFWDRVSTEIGHTQNPSAPDSLLNTE